MLAKLNISSRLKIVGVNIALLTLLLGGVGYAMVTRMSKVTADMHNLGLVGSKLLAEANNAVWELRFGIANYTLASSDNRRKIVEGRPALLKTVEDSLASYASLSEANAQDPALAELVAALAQYKSGAPKWFELVDADRKEEAADYRAKVTNVAGGAMVKSIRTLIDKQLRTNEELADTARQSAERAKTLLVAIGAAVLVITVSALWLLARAIWLPLNEIESQISAVATDRDFTRRLANRANDEIGRTAQAFNQLMATMQTSLRELLQSVDAVSRAAEALSQSSAQVAAGSARQNEATATIAATVEQVTVSISSVADSAREALTITAESGELSTRGQEVIQKTVGEVLHIAEAIRQTAEAIGEVGQQSRDISSVVQVIKEVADQTNLLALNAAIEAARAGELGRGFAVVADEVRKLAERTTQATLEISQMIGSVQQSSETAVSRMNAAVTQTDLGVALAKQAGESIDQIREKAGSVTVVVKEIASALAEQSTASNSISVQVESVAHMTDANSHATDDMSTAIRSLESLAFEMRAIGQRFRI